MKILIVTQINPYVRSVSTVCRYVKEGRARGHDIAVFGEPQAGLDIPFTLDPKGTDLALFVMQVASDLPDMPHIAKLIDAVPRERRVIVDLWGRYNDTIRLEHDFNHLEKVDHHLGWEWQQAFDAMSDVILQPTLKPVRSNVRPFLFHGFDAGSVVRDHPSAHAAAVSWQSGAAGERPYGAMYIGSNWQRWDQVRAFLSAYEPARARAGRVCLMGWDWDKRPDWAVQNDIAGVDTDPEFLKRLDVDCYDGVRFDEIAPLLAKARFAPVFHRPLFRKLGFVTIRTFETFYADSMPLLMLPRELVGEILGAAALKLVPGEDLASHIDNALTRPEGYWEAVLETRRFLAANHSFQRRFDTLIELARPGAAR